jgi:hypothetical protein
MKLKGAAKYGFPITLRMDEIQKKIKARNSGGEYSLILK